jgi:crossover junction endodeoxyribonuclease RuvC
MARAQRQHASKLVFAVKIGGSMRVLGIDPGSRITGYGIVDQQGNRLIHVDNGAIFTDKATDFAGRLKRIFDGLTEVIAEYHPDQVAVENIFFSTNVQSALKLGQARGAAIVAAVHAGLPVAEYTALQVKQAVVGQGRAEKGQVQKMLKVLLGLPEIAQEDASDALAVAVCHINSHELLQKAGPAISKRKTSWRNYIP